MTPKKIFVSGPLTNSGTASEAEMKVNAWAAIRAGATLVEKGHYPFIPHLNMFVNSVLEDRGVTIPWAQWMDLDDSYLVQCDMLLSLGSSEGADAEMARAEALGITIFINVGDIPPVSEDHLLQPMPRFPLPPVIDPNLDMLVLADMLKALRDRKKLLEDEVKTYNSVIEMTELLLFEKMAEEEMQRFSRAGYTFYLNPRTYVSAPPENAAAVNQWFRDHEMGDLIKETINPRTLSSQVNGMMGDGGTKEDLPEDLRTLLNFYEKPQVGIRRG